MAVIFRMTEIPGYDPNDKGINDCRYTRDMLGEQVEKCSFCHDGDATAYWGSREGIISCCRKCAREVLPALMADVLVGEHGTARPHVPSELIDEWDKAEAHFWKAAVIAVHGTIRQGTPIKVSP